MSVYRCDVCEETKDADFDGCEENPKNEFGILCGSCSENLACYYCGKTDLETKYCKYTDQYYHEGCVYI